MSFGFETTAAEVLSGVDLTGKRAIVTGGASGIGIETARAFASAGAEVTIAVRDTEAGERTAADLTADTGNKQVSVAPLDLSDQNSVRAFAAGWDGPLHILVNNAGVMALPDLRRTPQGWELQFATNHLGHFALTTGLLPALRAANGARVVAVSSSAHHFSPVVFDDIHFERREYEPWRAYGQSKTANILFAVEADRRWSGDGIRVNALHPGSIRTNLQRHVDPAELERLARETRAGEPRRMKTTQQGAATSVLLAASPTVDGVGGKYYEDCNEARPHTAGMTGVSAHALDPDAAARLWDLSHVLIGA
ncbi:MAG TPA: SDR family NAD(P)-dependent oxidoreductase [Dactylosporangium sp.]|jgi:NAD(P)-dependent dehydrogenase (short-subunit alcohol dehydrogenase family)|nr:SDR family NAD(P)-dependent oxidoreductase [Dactylosporangium sp.]